MHVWLFDGARRAARQPAERQLRRRVSRKRRSPSRRPEGETRSPATATTCLPVDWKPAVKTSPVAVFNYPLHAQPRGASGARQRKRRSRPLYHGHKLRYVINPADRRVRRCRRSAPSCSFCRKASPAALLLARPGRYGLRPPSKARAKPASATHGDALGPEGDRGSCQREAAGDAVPRIRHDERGGALQLLGPPCARKAGPLARGEGKRLSGCSQPSFGEGRDPLIHRSCV